jgi:hypothetical protein
VTEEELNDGGGAVGVRGGRIGYAEVEIEEEELNDDGANEGYIEGIEVSEEELDDARRW